MLLDLLQQLYLQLNKKIVNSKPAYQTTNINTLILKMLLFHGIRIDELINLHWDKVQ